MHIYRYGLLVLLLSMMILGYPTQLITVGPIPIGELLLLLGLVLAVPSIPQFLLSDANKFMFPVMILVFLVSVRLAFDFEAWGIIALRDASHYIDMLSIFVGFAAIYGLRAQFDWVVKLIFAFALVLLAMYPLRETLTPLFPSITNANGLQISLLSFTSLAAALVSSAFCVFARPNDFNKTFRQGVVFMAIFALALLVQMLQARTIYLQVGVSLYVLLLIRPRLVKKLPLVIFGFISIVILLSPLGMMTGRLGVGLNFEGLINHFLAIVGIQNEGFEGAAAGVDMRFYWWENIIDQLTKKYWSLLFGLGFGIPLTDFTIEGGVIARELHSSFMSSLGRLGIIGAVFVLWLWGAIIHFHWKTIKLLRFGRLSNPTVHVFSLFFTVNVFVFSLGEDAFEKPFNALPFYLLVGVCAALRANDLMHVRKKNANEVRLRNALAVSSGGRLLAHTKSIA